MSELLGAVVDTREKADFFFFPQLLGRAIEHVHFETS